MSEILSQDFYFDDTESVAKKILGKTLCRRLNDGTVMKGKITEVEAYLGVEDPACHTFGGRQTQRVQSMYLDGGHSYVYFIYGMYYCLNVVTRTAEHPEAILIRALEVMGEDPKEKQKANGPGKLCRHFQITKDDDGLRLWKKKSNLWIEDAESLKKTQILARPRIGVAYAREAAEWPLRFYIKDNPSVSKK